MNTLVSAGDFTKIYDPSEQEEGWYINDHCLIRGDDGLWHMFGITHAEPANPQDEKHFAHATAKTLLQSQWQKQDFALSVDPVWHERHLWAPHVIRHDDLYYMFYCAGDEDDALYRIHLATSTDLWNWQRHAANPMLQDGYHARDPMVLRVGDEWLMYYTATSGPYSGNHVVACVRSSDLLHWSDKRVVLVHERTGTYGGPCESPFVVQRGKYFYLFAGPEAGYDDTETGYRGQVVYRSDDAFHWERSQQVGIIDAHASEIVRDETGRWFVTHCGWGQGGLYIAPLHWNDGIDE
jgi:beta-fructofuranosidase